ncbi:MAG: hypothetical protein V3R96_04530 [Dehalococcoidales bacterium]
MVGQNEDKMIDEKKQDELQELTRQEAIRSWKRRREQDDAARSSYNDLEMILGRLDKKIKEHNPQRTVIAPLYRGQEMTIDKSTRSIVLDRQPSGSSPKRQVISFSIINGVSIDYYRKRARIRGNSDVWRVSLNTGDTKIQNTTIDSSSEENYVYDLAKAIGALTGAEVKENSCKPDPPRFELVFDRDNMPKIMNL